MAITERRPAFLAGLRDAAPFMLVVGPFGLLFGVVASEAGLPLVTLMGFSVLVIAGAAQLTALQLLQDGAPTLIILATALAVNLRMAMYSAALAPYLGGARLRTRAAVAYALTDQAYAAAALRYEAEPEMPLAARVAYYAGAVAPVVPAWYATTLAGALVGSSIPPALALDFALPITFIALVAPALRTMAHLAAATVSVTVSLALAWMPYSSGLLVAALLAMAAGAEVERRAGRGAA